MSSFSITFLFSVPKSSSLNTKSNSNQRKKKPGSTPSVKADIPEYTRQSLSEDGTGTLELDSLLGAFQISYNICGANFDINILCWSEAAKVSGGHHVSFVKTIHRGNYIFCSFSIRHVLKLFHGDLQNLFDGGIAFHVTRTGSTKTDAIKELYYNIQELGHNPDFCPLYLDPPRTNVLSAEVVSELIWKRFVEAVPDRIFDLAIDVPDVTDIDCQNAVIDIIEKGVRVNLQPTMVESWPLLDRSSHLARTKSETQTRNDKSTKKKVDKPQKGTAKNQTKGYCVYISGQKIFGVARKYIEEVCPVRTSELPHFSVFLKATGLIDHHQISSFNPFMIHIEKIDNLPLEQLEEKGFTHIYTTWKWMGYDHSSLVFPLAPTVFLNDLFTIILTDDLSADVIAELYSYKLHVKVHGFRQPNPTPDIIKDSFFGSDKHDNLIGKQLNLQDIFKMGPHPKREEEDILIASADFDLSSIFSGICQLELEQNCMNVADNCHMCRAPCGYNRTTNETNIVASDSARHFSKCSFENLPNFLYLEHNTTINLVASSSGPLLVDSQTKRSKYNRLLFRMKDFDYGKEVLRIILENNAVILDNTKLEAEARNPNWSDRDMLTGFVMDNGSYSLFYIEGMVNRSILHVWTMIMSLELSVAVTQYNSATIYDERVYKGVIFSILVLIVQWHRNLSSSKWWCCSQWRPVKRKLCCYCGVMLCTLTYNVITFMFEVTIFAHSHHVVPLCSSRTTGHRFPSDMNRRKMWLVRK